MATKRVRYVGPHAAVNVGESDGPLVNHGEIFETTAEHADRLLEQTDNWEAVKASSKADKAKGGDD